MNELMHALFLQIKIIKSITLFPCALTTCAPFKFMMLVFKLSILFTVFVKNQVVLYICS